MKQDDKQGMLAIDWTDLPCFTCDLFFNSLVANLNLQLFLKQYVTSRKIKSDSVSQPFSTQYYSKREG